MTDNQLITRLQRQPIVTDEDALYALRVLGGSFEAGAAASAQGGGTLLAKDWNGHPLVGRTIVGAMLALLVEEHITPAGTKPKRKPDDDGKVGLSMVDG
jgi:hypothetical protein